MPTEPAQSSPPPSPTPPRRARFQIHLSTAIVLMFVAGGLIWANVRASWNYVRSFDNITWTNREFGCPFTGVYYFEHINQDNPEYVESIRFYTPSYIQIALNLIIAFLILFACWFICEWLIRRRAARKGD